MTNGVLAGLLLTEMIDRRSSPRHIYDPRRIHPILEARSVARTGMKTVANLATSRLLPLAGTVDAATDLRPSEAGIVTDEEGTWASYVDDEGGMHAVSAACTQQRLAGVDGGEASRRFLRVWFDRRLYAESVDKDA